MHALCAWADPQREKGDCTWQQLHPQYTNDMSPLLPGEDWGGVGEARNIPQMDASSMWRKETSGVGEKCSPYFTDGKTEVT